MEWKQITGEEAKEHPEYGFGGGLYVVYLISIVWCLHSIYIVFLDSEYMLVEYYGCDNKTMADFASFVQILLTLPFMYLAPKLSRVLISVSVSMFSVNWAIWFTFGMISPEAVPLSITVTTVSFGIIVYLMRSTRVNVTYSHRSPV